MKIYTVIQLFLSWSKTSITQETVNNGNESVSKINPIHIIPLEQRQNTNISYRNNINVTYANKKTTMKIPEYVLNENFAIIFINIIDTGCKTINVCGKK